jgi:glycosyltransferase involved in cell wall biosynthesis
MGAGNCVIAKDTPENREVLAGAGLFFRDAENLRAQMELTLADRQLVEGLRLRAQDRAKACYSWDAVTDAYEQLFRDLIQV